MDCYYYFLNHRTTSELVSEVTLTLYNNIHILLAMTDSDTQLEEEIEELSVRETETGPPHFHSQRGPCPDPNLGNGGWTPDWYGGGTPGDSRNGVGGSASSANQTHRSCKTGSAPESLCLRCR